jgi:hypothetical protein
MQDAKNLNPVAHIDGDAMTRDLVASNCVMALWNTSVVQQPLHEHAGTEAEER